MYCEKLKLTPGNWASSVSLTSSMSFSLLTPLRHSFAGLSGAKNSALKKPVASVPSSGRPFCDTTVTTSGSPILDVALNFFEYFVESGFAPDACRGVRLRALYSGVRRRRHGLLFDLPEQLVDFLVGEFWVPSLH